MFYSAEQQRLSEMGVTEEQDRAEMWNVEEIEREKEEEEYRLETVIVIETSHTLDIFKCVVSSCSQERISLAY